MRIKTIIILAIAIVLTIIFMQNLEAVKFTVLFSTLYISKVTVMLIVAVISFVLGFLVGRPGNTRYNHVGYDTDSSAEVQENKKLNTLSDDDRDYLN